QMDVHFAVSFQYPNPPSRTCAQNGRISSEMAGGGRRRAYGAAMVLSPYADAAEEAARRLRDALRDDEAAPAQTAERRHRASSGSDM
ncbi:MAG: hypothetical protein ACK4P8_09945, partial [Tabrizicola sp.]